MPENDPPEGFVPHIAIFPCQEMADRVAAACERSLGDKGGSLFGIEIRVSRLVPDDEVWMVSREFWERVTGQNIDRVRKAFLAEGWPL